MKKRGGRTPIGARSWGKQTRGIAKRCGEALSFAREMLGLSQVEVAKRADIARVTLSNIERGMSAPTVDTLIVLCDVLGVKPETIVAHAAKR